MKRLQLILEHIYIESSFFIKFELILTFISVVVYSFGVKFRAYYETSYFLSGYKPYISAYISNSYWILIILFIFNLMLFAFIWYNFDDDK
jgi:hypothetical protein